MKATPEKRIHELEGLIRKHQYLYYVKNEPVISDKEFDTLFRELQDLEKKYPEFSSAHSPTRVVGADLTNSFEKVQHKIPVLSLENTYSANELMEWVNKNGILEVYSLEWKIDGASVVLYYENGILEKAVSRGTGGIGDDITENVKTIKSIPARLNADLTVYIRGEIYIRWDDFEKINNESDGRFANPRNLAAGSVKQKSPAQVAVRPLRIFVYDAFFPQSSNLNLTTHEDILKNLDLLFLPTQKETVFVDGNAIPEYLKKFEKQRTKLDFPVDGLVIKLNNLEKRNQLGFTSHSPRWARAFKFDADGKETEIINITCSVGRTGKITPRAEIRPVQIAGSKVSFATLHNQNYIQEMGIGIGAIVRVVKRGEIIPAVEELIQPGISGIYLLPEKCPSCNSKLTIVDDSVDLFCTNDNCDERKKNRIIFFCQKKQMDIEGLGEKQVMNFYNSGYIKSIPDIYRLHNKQDEIKQLDGYGDKSIALLLKGIENSKKKPFRIVLASLGIPELGPKVSEVLIENGYHSIHEIIELVKKKNASEILESIYGIGPKTANSLIKYLLLKETIELIKELESLGLNFQEKFVSNKNNLGVFIGQIWCATGTFENFQPREKALEIIQKFGGKISNTVTSKTTHLLAGNNPGSKLSKANKSGTIVVDENGFLDILNKNQIKLT